MTGSDPTDDRLAALEARLDRYHAELEAAIDQRDNFNLSATWGILKGLVGAVAFLGATYGTSHWFESAGWLAAAAAGLVALIVAMLIAGLLIEGMERGERADQGKLSRLPRWRRHD